MKGGFSPEGGVFSRGYPLMGPPRLGSQVGYWVQYKLISVEVEMRTIEISSPSFRIHRGRLDNVMKIYISTICKKNIIKIYF